MNNLQLSDYVKKTKTIPYSKKVRGNGEFDYVTNSSDQKNWTLWLTNAAPALIAGTLVIGGAILWRVTR
jgi:hypothetical protein